MKIFHHNDADGRCAAAIAIRYAMTGTVSFKDTELIEMDYKDSVDIERIKPKEDIIIVDFSFKPEIMNKVLEKTDNIFWLDHHETAFKYEPLYSKSILGLRSEAFSGCELAWQYFCGDKQMPRSVELIGDYDKWALKFQPECFEFYEGLKMEDTSPNSSLWDRLLESIQQDAKDGWFDSILHQGRSAIKYRDNYCEKMCHDFGYETELDGHKAFACNIYQFGSKGFGERMNQYPFCIAYAYDGRRWTVSLYSINGVKVNEICAKYGGGGHPGAAGFVTDSLPFEKELKDKK